MLSVTGCQAGESSLELHRRPPGDAVVHEAKGGKIGIPADPEVLEAHPEPWLDLVVGLGAGQDEGVVAEVGSPVRRLLLRVLVEPTPEAGTESHLREDLVLG